ncbi:MAG: class I SAM-dependent methyltransferase [Stygiobacter sp.]
MKAQESGWYAEFLMPVVDNIMNITTARKVLDIGTGPGKLPELLSQNQQLKIIGVDIEPTMIEEANKRVSSDNVIFQLINKNESLRFENKEFDVITFCSVLFLLNNEERGFLMNEALRVLKPGGKIIVLTPSGEKSLSSAVKDVRSFPHSVNNYTFLIWNALTSNRGGSWCNEKWLSIFTEEKGLKYNSTLVFKNYASMEIITKFKELKNDE